ncbi:MAG: hypothetical protein AMJ95_05935 [Omnitrophica WOR_2 bacterium SM23_72]|nr:MAG: hypothetical protein AMJ95_05935 [Omnitrophica WOR_2 bacterium SM23_72]
MPLEEKILNDYKEAMKAKDTLKSSALNFLRAEMLNVAIAKKKQKLEDTEVLAVIRKQVKEHQDSIEQFQKGGRTDLADKESKELEILKSYLPPPLPKEQIQKIIEEVASELGAKDMKDMGRVMKEVSAKCAGAADGKTVSELVRERLSKPPEVPG